MLERKLKNKTSLENEQSILKNLVSAIDYF